MIELQRWLKIVSNNGKVAVPQVIFQSFCLLFPTFLFMLEFQISLIFLLRFIEGWKIT